MNIKRPLLSDLSAVVCTLNSIDSIERCLTSLRDSGVGEIIVIDGRSEDGTFEVAQRLATHVASDAGKGLGAARNLGIGMTSGELVIIFGADNVATGELIPEMITCLFEKRASGVGALTVAEGNSYLTKALNTYRRCRFSPGKVNVIGSPTLFRGEMIRNHPFDESRRFSDDSELCDRWKIQFGSTFWVCNETVLEIGRTSLKEIWGRWGYYGISDYENFVSGSKNGWNRSRKLKSILYPLKVEFFQPLGKLRFRESIFVLPFLLLLVIRRYSSWVRYALTN